jgi:hypothetical protein
MECFIAHQAPSKAKVQHYSGFLFTFLCSTCSRSFRDLANFVTVVRSVRLFTIISCQNSLHKLKEAKLQCPKNANLMNFVRLKIVPKEISFGQQEPPASSIVVENVLNHLIKCPFYVSNFSKALF